MKTFDHSSLKQWFNLEKRDLPWRQNLDPYAIWVSEVMLQQTQVVVVIPYFERWMERFPTIESLAEAPLDDVIKLWEGLGYYSRARNLHEGAKFVLEHYDGKLPSDENKLQKIKGLGPYTIGAIRSFAFQQKTAAVDGNVIRVLARYFLIEDDISKPKTIKKIWEHASALLPNEEPWVVNEALIELGATVCMRKPKCSICPLRKSCSAYPLGAADKLPFKSAKVRIENLYRAVTIIESNGHLLVKKGEKGKIMSGLQEFPYFECDPDNMNHDHIIKTVHKELQLEIHFQSDLEEIGHSFTRYRVRLFPKYFHCKSLKPIAGHDWLTYADLDKLAFSSGHRRIYESLKMNRI